MRSRVSACFLRRFLPLVVASLGFTSSTHAELVAHWPLDEGFENVVDENFDGYLVTVPVPSIVDFVPVVPEKDGTGPLQEFAAQFTGANSFVQTDYPGIGENNPRSITCWIKTSQPGGNDIFGYGTPTNGLKWHTRVNTNAGNGLVGAIRTEYQGGQNVGTTVVDDGLWHHIAAVFPEGAINGQEIVHYVDGVVQGHTGGDRAILTGLNPAYNVTIGMTRQSATALRWFHGLIADVRVYDHGLSAVNIVEVMNDEELTEPIACTSMEISCETSEEDNTATATLTLEPADCACDSVSVSVDGRELGTRSAAGGQVVLQLDELCSAEPGADVEVTFRCFNTEVSATCALSCPEPIGLVAHWPLDAGKGDVFVDIEGGYDGYLANGAVVTWGEGPPTQEFAAEFSGTSSWIQTDYSGVGGASPRTVTAWIKTTTPPVNNGIVSWGQDASTRKWHIRLNNNAANGTVSALRVEVNGGFTIGTTPLNDGEWHHTAVVVPQGASTTDDVHLFVDGQLEAKSGTNLLTVNTNIGAGSRTVEIGRRVNGNGSANYFPGSIADVRIYDIALTDIELLSIATGGRCVARRSLSSSRYVPGDTVTVSLSVVNVVAGTRLTETLPDGWTVSGNPDGGEVVDSTIRFDLDADGAVSYDVTIPEEFCSAAEISGSIAGEDCAADVVGTSSLSCLAGCAELQESGAVRDVLVIGPVAAGRNTNASGGCDDQGPDGSFDTLDYLATADGLGEPEIEVVFGDELQPDFGGAAGGAGVGDSPNPNINPRRGEGVLTVWAADADSTGSIAFDDADNIGTPFDDYIVYSLVYLQNNTDDALPVVLEVGSDDAVKVLVNGELVWVNAVCRSIPAYGLGDRVVLDGITNPALLPGTNFVLIAVVDRGGGNLLRLVVRDELDAPLVDGSVTACLTPDEVVIPEDEDCDNGEDDDDDGLVDCLDDDCEGDVACPTGARFVRGDSNSSGVIDLTDGVVTLNFLFTGGPAPDCRDAADTDGNNALVISDAVITFSYLFTGGPPPVPPSPTQTNYAVEDCGPDPDENAALDCATPPAKCQ